MFKRKKKKRVDIHATTSDKKGFSGALESFIRTFKNFSWAVVLTILASVVIISMGVSLAPGLFLVSSVYHWTINAPAIIHFLLLGISIVTGYFLYGFTYEGHTYFPSFLVRIIPEMHQLYGCPSLLP